MKKRYAKIFVCVIVALSLLLPVSLMAEDKININTATLNEIIKLPSIGPVIAQRIIDYREKIGLFHAVEDIMQIKGIGVKKFAAIKNLIIVEVVTEQKEDAQKTSD
ncbi:competence protein ComEA [Candidatus Magnetomoraceae bacterium gMMP-15]